MRAAVLHGPNDLRVEEVAKPTPGPQDVVVRIHKAAVCGTDLHIYAGRLKANYPVILGHEFSGTISEVGSQVSGWRVGDSVFSSPNVFCGECYYCKTGQGNLCVDVKVLGLHQDGAFAEHIRLPARALYKLPSGISFEEGALIGDQFATTAHGLMKAGIKFGDFIQIFGAGPIGLFTAQIAKASGATASIVDVVPDRLQFAREVLGVDYTINSKEEDPVRRVMALTNGLGADITVEAIGIPITLEQAVMAAKRNGKVLVIGIFEKPAEVNMLHVVYREKTIIGSFAHAQGDMEKVLCLLQSGRVSLKPFTRTMMPLSDVGKAIELFERRDPGIIKVIIQP